MVDLRDEVFNLTTPTYNLSEFDFTVKLSSASRVEVNSALGQDP